MDREEAKKQYKEEISKYLQDGMELLQENWKIREDEVKHTILEALLQLFSDNGDKEQIQYVQMSLLRSQMDEDIYKMLLSLHSENYFLDSDPRMQTVDISCVFAPLKEVRTKLYQTTGSYQGKIERFDADRIIRETAMIFYKKRANDCRMLFRDLGQLRVNKGLPDLKWLIVKWGGLQEESETVYLTDTREKSQAQFLTYNEKNSIDQWNIQYVYQSWETTDFEDMTVERKNFLFLMLRNCKIKRCRWENCMLHGAEFQNAKMEQTIFAGCDMSGSDFRNADLYQVQFVGCNLTNADFTGAKFEKTQFPGSQMTDAMFSRNGLYCEGLDANQLQQVRLEEEPYVF